MARSRGAVSVTVQASPAPGAGLVEGIEMDVDARSLQTAGQLTSQYVDDIVRAVEEAVVSACSRGITVDKECLLLNLERSSCVGPLLSYPVMDTSIRLMELNIPRSAPIPVVTVCAVECTAKVRCKSRSEQGGLRLEDRQTVERTDKQTDSKSDGQTDRHTGIQTDRQTSRQRDLLPG